MNYFIAPRSGERSYKNFQSTIKNGVPIHIIEDFISQEGLEKISKQEVVYAWGNREGTKSNWQRMQPGDLVIFYAQKKLVMYGEIYYKEHNPQLALSMWPPDEKGNPWEYTFFLKNLKYISIPIQEFNNLVGYKSNFIIQGFMELKDERKERIESFYESVDKYLELFSVNQSEEMPTASDKISVNINKIKPSVKIDPKINKSLINSRNGINHNGNVLHEKTKINYEVKNRNNSLIGNKGEQLVFNNEIDYLKSVNRKDLASKVERVSIDDDSLGYDILSFDKYGNEKYIEVKTTTVSSSNIGFFISENELTFSKSIKNYFIYYVEWNHGINPTINIFSDPFIDEKFLLVPTNYKVLAKKA